MAGEPDPVYDQDRQMTHSLFLAQQNANHRLEEMEDRAVNDPISSEDPTHPTEPPSPPSTPLLSTDTSTCLTRNRSSIMIDAVVYDPSPTFTPAEQKRTSVLLNECVLEADRSFEFAKGRPPQTLNHRQSLVHSDSLLQRWTKQFDSTLPVNLDKSHQAQQHKSPVEPTQESESAFGTKADSQSYSRQDALILRVVFPDIHVSEDEAGERNHPPLYTRTHSSVVRKPSLTLETTESIAVPPDFGFKTSFTENVDGGIIAQTDSALELPSDLSPTPSSVKIWKSLLVGLGDPCYKVLPVALRKYNIQADWRNFALYIIHGDQERPVGLNEMPLQIFRDLDREGGNPVFELRKLTLQSPSSGVLPESPSSGIPPKSPSSGILPKNSSCGVGLPGMI